MRLVNGDLTLGSAAKFFQFTRWGLPRDGRMGIVRFMRWLRHAYQQGREWSALAVFQKEKVDS